MTNYRPVYYENQPLPNVAAGVIISTVSQEKADEIAQALQEALEPKKPS